jgi:hypothetical protein
MVAKADRLSTDFLRRHPARFCEGMTLLILRIEMGLTGRQD